MNDLEASLTVTGTGFLADPAIADAMAQLLASAAIFCARPENFPKFRLMCLEFAQANGPDIREWVAAMEPDFLDLMAGALSPGGLHD